MTTTLSPSTRYVFVDTSAFYGGLDERDQWHALARPVFHTLANERFLLVTSNLVVAETHRLLLNRLGTTLANHWLASLIDINVIYQTPADHQHTMSVIAEQPAVPRTYTDASAIAMMRANGIQTAFSFDRHFEYVGIQRIPQVGR